MATEPAPPSIDRVQRGAAGRAGDTAAVPGARKPVVGAPAPFTTLIGRVRERGEVLDLLDHHRLVTLTGTGGSGKTRLALAVAESLDAEHVVWVALSALNDEELVAQTIAERLEVPEPAGRSYEDGIVAALGELEAVLVLDTCEHVLETVGSLAERMLARCPTLRLLATSQAPLRVPGEIRWRLPPLRYPDPRYSEPRAGEGTSVEEHVARYDAVALFAERARSVRPGFAFDGSTLEAVGSICARVDGNPLAIELAAARAGVLSVRQIAAALADSVDLLVERGHGRPARQQTLRAALDWSHRLLDPGESDLFARLSVFVGGATLDAVEEVAAADIDPGAVLDLLAGLVDKSLVRMTEDREGTRYQLPDPIRRYAAELLEESGSAAASRDRHSSWFLAMADDADQQVGGRDQYAAFDRLEADLPNLRAAFDWALLRGDRATALVLASALSQFCAARDHRREGRAWLDRAIDATEHSAADELVDNGVVEPATLATAYDAAGIFAFLGCDYRAAVGRLESAARIYDQLGDQRGTASVTRTLGSIAREQGDYERADQLLRDSTARWQGLGDDSAAGRALNLVALTALLRGDHEVATGLSSSSLAVARRLHDHEAAVSSLLVLGGAALVRDDVPVAQALFSEALSDSERGHYAEGIAYANEGLGLVALTKLELDEAGRLLRDALRRQHRMGDRWRSAALLVHLAAVERLQENLATAIRLLAAAEVLLEQIGGALAIVERAALDRIRASAAAMLSPEDFALAWTGGRAAPLDVVVNDLLDDASSVPRQRAPEQRERQASSGLTVLTLGQEEIQLDGRVLRPGDFSYAKPRELLYFLLESETATKTDIGLALWPDASATELRGAFHTTLHHLRRAIGATVVTYVGGRYRIERTGLRYDVDDFTDALRSARAATSTAEEVRLLRTATDHYGGAYLPETAPGWADARRVALKDRFERALLALGRRLMAAQRHAAAAEVFRRAIASDPLLESGHRELMRAYAASGEPSRAVRQFESLAAMLRDELGTAPADETVKVLQAIRIA